MNDDRENVSSVVVLVTLSAGRRLEVGRWRLDVGRWTLDVGRWTLEAA
jgi:hypothetical protein